MVHCKPFKGLLLLTALLRAAHQDVPATYHYNNNTSWPLNTSWVLHLHIWVPYMQASTVPQHQKAYTSELSKHTCKPSTQKI